MTSIDFGAVIGQGRPSFRPRVVLRPVAASANANALMSVSADAWNTRWIKPLVLLIAAAAALASRRRSDVRRISPVRIRLLACRLRESGRNGARRVLPRRRPLRRGGRRPPRLRRLLDVRPSDRHRASDVRHRDARRRLLRPDAAPRSQGVLRRRRTRVRRVRHLVADRVDAAAKLRQLPGVRRVGIVGWSMGGGVAVRAAVDAHTTRPFARARRLLDRLVRRRVAPRPSCRRRSCSRAVEPTRSRCRRPSRSIGRSRPRTCRRRSTSIRTARTTGPAARGRRGSRTQPRSCGATSDRRVARPDHPIRMTLTRSLIREG